MGSSSVERHNRSVRGHCPFISPDPETKIRCHWGIRTDRKTIAFIERLCRCVLRIHDQRKSDDLPARNASQPNRLGVFRALGLGGQINKPSVPCENTAPESAGASCGPSDAVPPRLPAQQQAVGSHDNIGHGGHVVIADESGAAAPLIIEHYW